MGRSAGLDRDEAVLRTLADRKVFVVPTMTVTWRALKPEGKIEELQERLETVQWMYRAGVRLVLGGDEGTFNTPFDETVYGLELFRDVSLSNLEILQSATKTAAECLGIADRTGTLAAGKQADIIAVRGNPLDDVANLWNVEHVVKAGVIVK